MGELGPFTRPIAIVYVGWAMAAVHASVARLRVLDRQGEGSRFPEDDLL